MTKVSDTTNSKEAGESPLNPPLVTLHIEGRLFSFKTEKRGALSRSKTGKVFSRPITRPEHARKMKQWIQAMKCELSSAMAQAKGQTQMVPAPQRWIVLYEQLDYFVRNFDDRAKYVRRLVIDVEFVPAGQEGATVEIRRR